MTDWHSILARLANNADNAFDSLKNRMAARFGGLDPLKIVAYNTFGSPDRFFIKGRVLEDRGEQTAGDHDRLWHNLVNMYRRMESDEVPHARLRARFQTLETDIICNDEGYFETWLDLPTPADQNQIWHTVQLELLSPQSRQQPEPVRAISRVFVPPKTARFAVISDIDDTVVLSDAARLLSMARHVFMGNARTRLPFPGVAAFYRALLGSEVNPLFYVSSSPWNLYDLLVDFFHLQDIPIGPLLFLRDWGMSKTEILPTRNREYKLAVIQQLLDFYQELPFILIGDSGQEDPEIYREVVNAYPGRILAVYIRDVSESNKRDNAIRSLSEEVRRAGCNLILADNTLTFARDAAEHGWISATALKDITAEVARAATLPPLFEEQPGA